MRKGGSCGSPHKLSVYISVYVQFICVYVHTGLGERVEEKGVGRRRGKKVVRPGT